MKEEKSMTEYKESKGIFQWLKSKWEKIKEKFRPTKNNEVKEESLEGQELTEEQLDKVRGGIPFETVDIEELKADLGITEPKSWELTEEQLETANAIHVNDELTEEELEEVKGGQPLIDEDEYEK